MGIRVRPFRVEVAESELVDLRERLARTRWPEAAPVAGWAQGIPREVVRDLCAYWADGYDWRAAEARLNAVPQSMVTVDGVDVHVLHARSPHPGAFPLVITHGWPGSVLELVDLVGPLTDPDDPADAFDVVIPSLPGYGFSGRPDTAGWGVERIADAWAELMAGLGYDRYGAAGSDWGTSVSSCLAAQHRDHVAGIHLIPPLAGPDPARPDDLTEEERTALQRIQERGRSASAYSEIHRTAPQTLGYALVDSPAGLCAWLGEKLLTWGDGLTRDQVLDQVSLYWLTGTAASSARLYAESIERIAGWITGVDAEPVDVPVGASVFHAEVPWPSRRWAARRYPDIRHWSTHDRGGHFPALEVPGLLVDDLRAFFRQVR
ncbi:epoxide hydrolase family protein [Actinoplanes utahensis]|uniref:Epoxide hydrolase n=1 Tax=Actinoplanes utahensis TaxID=1869 RepID=A0A0A6XBA7_ACTUT|nr:epoxide hydrolase family protein [Actinoplanes utahensis]KHD77357.1 epoxide hydrolase [Actinoplanes utahensis]GIF32898.1 hydrolase [Actinoplanes utahensis]